MATAPALTTPVGLLACQKDTYLNVLDTTVIACSEKPNSHGQYEVELADTVLFPEGGGQPSDHGSIDDLDVRLDHAQQHSAQHLLSAILETKYGLQTVAWNLGEQRSHVELKTERGFKLSSQAIADIEQSCNNAIRRSMVVNVEVRDQSADTQPNSIPADYNGGVVRHIIIDGVDRNPCCGTHVNNTAELQVMKLCSTDTIRGGNTRLFFMAGGRVIDYAQSALDRERRLTTILSCGPNEHADAVERLGKQQRDALKSAKGLFGELADFIASDLKQELQKTGFAAYHREEGDIAFLSAISHSLGRQHFEAGGSGAALLTAGAAKAGGPVLIVGQEEAVATLSETVKSSVSGVRGGGKGPRWQGKATSWTGLDRALDSIKKHQLA
ncbi:hypothetical protein H4219_004705 [Mycoemilia scoparia]|uniref:Threonyl/alanyl tRNA synthetase SAD domain-containing protein n=1 Tax=Mycoemilia scoparia TaxID=417184 RepID=A0A9W8DRE9_9FUNG|nr:hypothetical protein H4219_004705 [Mycoemilia scoparia]